MHTRLLAALLSLGFSSVAWAQFPAGGEFRVNTFTNSYQTRPHVAVGPRGDFMVVWSSQGQDGSGYGVFARRYDALGTPQAAEFQVNATIQGKQYASDIAVDAGGNYIVVWISTAPGQDGSVAGIVGRVIGPSGVALTPEFPVNAFTPGEQDWPSVAPLPGGGFVVVWESYIQDGSSFGIFGRRFDSKGKPLGGDFQVNTFAAGRQEAPRVASDAVGNFTVVWHSGNFHDGDDFGIFGRRFNAAGTPLTGEFQINTYTPNYQLFPVVSAVADGRFAVAWESGNVIGLPTQDGNNYGVYARRYDAAGNPLGGEVQMNVYTTDHQHTPTVTAYGNGSFLAAWYSQDQVTPFPNQDVFARQVNASAVPGPEFPVNTTTGNRQYLADLAADEVGNIVATWASLGQDGSAFGIYARRFGGLVPFALAVDAIAVPSSNGNRVLESGELVVVQPWWRNVNGAALAFDGVASSFGGPAGPVYTLADGNAGYGSFPNNTAGSCGPGAGCYAMRVTGARPTPHWDAAFREDIAPAALGQSKVWTLHIGDTFTDVTRTNPFYRFVETVLHKNIMIGCSPSQFCPFVVVSRDRMAQYVLKSKEPTVPTACVAGLEMFADVPASNPYCPWIEELARRGVVAGCGGGNYCPSAGVSREQLAVFLLKTLDGIAYVPPLCGTPVFNDVPASSGFCPYVEELARRGVVTGCGGGAYCPTVSVTRDQMSVFLSVTFGLTLYGP